MRKLSVIFLAVAMLAACASPVPTEDTGSTLSDMHYWRDKYGNCYAMIGYISSHGFAMATIPCEKSPLRARVEFGG